MTIPGSERQFTFKGRNGERNFSPQEEVGKEEEGGRKGGKGWKISAGHPSALINARA